MFSIRRLTAAVLLLLVASSWAKPAQAAAGWSPVGGSINGVTVNEVSGRAVAMSDDGQTVAIGGPGSSTGGVGAGVVRVFRRDGLVWTQLGTDVVGGPSGGLGADVALSGDGNTLAYSEPNYSGTLTYQGRVRVRHWNGTSWDPVGGDIQGTAAYDSVGFSLAMNDDASVLVVGSSHADGNVGKVSVFHLEGGNWVQRGADFTGTADDAYFGRDVAINDAGDRIAISSDGVTSFIFQAGRVRVLEWNGSTWSQLGDALTGDSYEALGASLAFSDDGSTLAVGAPRNGTAGLEAGRLRVYRWTSGSWVLRGTPIDGAAASDHRGDVVSLNADGTTLVVGGVNGLSSRGNVTVYHFDGSGWSQLGSELTGDTVGNQDGSAVAMSDDGLTVAVGSQFDDSGATDAGAVRVYSIPRPAPALRSVSPDSGSTAGGTSITVFGSWFGGTPTVDIDGQPCTSVLLVSEYEITCVTPPHAAADATVVVTNGDTQRSTESLTFAFVADSLPPTGSNTDRWAVSAAAAVLLGLVMMMRARMRTAR